MALSAKRRTEILKQSRAFEGDSLRKAVMVELERCPATAARVLGMLESCAQDILAGAGSRGHLPPSRVVGGMCAKSFVKRRVLRGALTSLGLETC